MAFLWGNMKIAIYECHTKVNNIYERHGQSMNERDILLYSVSSIVGSRGKVRVFRPYLNEFPNIGSFDGFIISGSNENANEDSIRSKEWMKKLIVDIIKIHDRNIPLLGICFGHQIISAAFEGRLFELPNLEVGFKKIILQKEAVYSELFNGISRTFYGIFVHKWAVYKTSLPFGSKILALSPDIPDQAVAYSIGNRTFGLQFHPERNKKDALAIYAQNKVPNGIVKSSKMNTMILKNFINRIVYKQK